MSSENKRPTYRELWEQAFEGYDLSDDKSRLKRIFHQDSQWNIRLKKYSELCEEHLPDLDSELLKLGFYLKVTQEHLPSTTPQFTHYYYNKKGDIVEINQAGSVVVKFNDDEKMFESNLVGEKETQALEWIKKKLGK